MGRYGKGHINNNGAALLECISKHDLTLTNTLFQHKLSHRTTWTGNKKNCLAHDGNPRRNPYRNQIDYIITKSKHRHFIQHSRSYGGCLTDTDHKLVKMTTNTKWYKIKNEKVIDTGLNVQNFIDKNYQEQYKKRTSELYKEQKDQLNNDTKNNWLKIIEVCNQAGEETLGKKERTKRSENKEVNTIANKKKKIKLDNENTKDQTKIKHKHKHKHK